MSPTPSGVTQGWPRGFVSIVGAGPGDPELLTRKGAARLAEADLVLYDALVDPIVLELAPHAQRVFVGKRAGRPSVRQEFIHRLLIRAALRGRRVVRLKGGDPFVFGRGGEEALALASAGVSFEIVPGVSAAIAAPALAGIPATHRGMASALVVVSGHAEASYASIIDSLTPHSATLVVLMGMTHAAIIASRLLARGWNGNTPAAVLFAASTADAETWTSTLAKLSSATFEDDRPGTIVIGEVVRLNAVIGMGLTSVARGFCVSPLREASARNASADGRSPIRLRARRRGETSTKLEDPSLAEAVRSAALR